MKTPMNVFNTAMKKKKKNRKGFSLVELIVVLVIMAILAAALVPTLIGYIRQTRQSNAKNEAAACVSAAQTIASSAFADPDGVYHNQGTGGDVKIVNGVVESGDVTDVIEYLAEVPAASVVSVTFDANNTVSSLNYKAENGESVSYTVSATGKGAYTVGGSGGTTTTTT